MRTVVITHDLEPESVEQIQTVIPDWRVIIGKQAYHSFINEAEVIVGWKKDLDETVRASSSLRWVQTWSAGVNNLPLNLLHEKRIQLTSANGVHAYPISETVLGLMLALTRKIHTYVHNQSEKKWHHSGISLEMHGKTVGIMGVGAIGKELARLCNAFHMNVLGVRHSGRVCEYVDEMYAPDELADVLPRCDYVVVTLPLTEETSGMFGAEQFALMKPSSFFINIGRGEIVVESELVRALDEGAIAGAGLDVFEVEPLPVTSPLWTMPNVIITPHTSGSTEHYAKRVIEDIFLPNLRAYVAGEAVIVNVVDYQKGY